MSSDRQKNGEKKKKVMQPGMLNTKRKKAYLDGKDSKTQGI